MSRNAFFFPGGEPKGFGGSPSPTSQDKDAVEVSGIVRHETELAWKFFDGTREVWLPKSKCEWSEDKNGHGTMSVPEWLAIEKGLV